jgi:hypothetical protein
MQNEEKFNKFIKIVEKFWEIDVWKVNYKNIYNKKIKDIIKNIQNNNYTIIDIQNIKNSSIEYIKLHAECIPEYHMLIINFKNNK